MLTNASGGKKFGIPLQKGVTPVRLEKKLRYLYRCLDQGFHFSFKNPSVVSEFGLFHRNLHSAWEHQEVVFQKPATEVLLNRMSAPFSYYGEPGGFATGVVPKKETNKFQLIHHLSFP